MTEPKVIGLNGIGLEVPDAATAEKFYGTFGLEARPRGSAIGFGGAGRPNDELLVIPGAAKKRMHHLSFIIRPDDAAAFEEKLKKHGFKTASAPAPRPGLWFQDPWGTWINLFAGFVALRANLSNENRRPSRRPPLAIAQPRPQAPAPRPYADVHSGLREVGERSSPTSSAFAPPTARTARSPSWPPATASSTTTASA